MAKFMYRAVTQENTTESGTLTAFTAGRARRQLERDGRTVLFVLRDNTSTTSRGIEIPFLFSGFSMPDRILWFRNLALMLLSGVTITDALRVLQEQSGSRRVRKIMAQMIRDIENGQKLSRAMERFPRYFSPFLMESVNVGEVTGTLTGTLDRLADDLEHAYELQRKVKSALAYPMVVIAVMLATLAVLMIYVLPKIADLFRELNAELPLPTRILLATSTFLQTKPYIVAAVIAGLVTAFTLVMKNSKGRYFMHFLFLKFPILGVLVREANLALLFRSLESLYASGISLMRSIEISEKTLTNEVYKKTLRAMQPLLIYGVPISELMKSSPFLFPPQAQRILEVGVRAGRLEECFGHLSAHYNKAVNHRTQLLTSLMEPFLMIMVGLVVGGIAVSIFLPIYGTVQIIQ